MCIPTNAGIIHTYTRVFTRNGPFSFQKLGIRIEPVLISLAKVGKVGWGGHGLDSIVRVRVLRSL